MLGKPSYGHFTWSTDYLLASMCQLAKSTLVKWFLNRRHLALNGVACKLISCADLNEYDCKALTLKSYALNLNHFQNLFYFLVGGILPFKAI
jgi:hypothetical protein